jgi:hypothetical protein
MTPLEPSAKWAWCSMLLLSAVGLWGWSIDPGHSARWVFVACFVPLFWGYVEFAQGDDLRRERATLMHWHRAVFAWSGFVMASHIAVQLAAETGLLHASWGPISDRLRWIITGGSLAVWGNFLPKLLSPWEPEDQSFDWARVQRFAGWLFLIAGVAVAAVWLVEPRPELAKLHSRVILGTTAVLTIGRKLISLTTPPGHLPKRSRGAG